MYTRSSTPDDVKLSDSAFCLKTSASSDNIHDYLRSSQQYDALTPAIAFQLSKGQHPESVYGDRPESAYCSESIKKELESVKHKSQSLPKHLEPHSEAEVITSDSQSPNERQKNLEGMSIQAVQRVKAQNLQNPILQKV